ncbi:MAG: 30S ribosomal protein S9 [Candidatus Buchananbacteria bacterium RIFCSPHIGHO2_01_FULL_44_11]|uniref:30S ribosomal protein S9 n=1 Tax=Candidatus Buchananbacteria bacterium RIFCSPHIGHO2_01_FULL_44_11 TaxID=1797535 RepID=A0A1G1Y2Q2_9BACT|nr:MAG: 30S ribosomal protein S9 [Candidatus Buchananbacteria bacterium RIFCSPHIGHO2_01_FULL_44_11]
MFAVGRRKKSVARVRLHKNGTGKITINQKDFQQYFPTLELQSIVKQPLVVTSKLENFDFTVKVAGGGSHGQAEACRHGIARALFAFDQELKPALKAEKLLRRDPRRKERKKPGLKRARRAPQWSKR